MNKEYEVEDFLNYVKGWLSSKSVRINRIDIEEMQAALHNSIRMLKDHQDGIDSFVERQVEFLEDWSME